MSISSIYSLPAPDNIASVTTSVTASDIVITVNDNITGCHTRSDTVTDTILVTLSLILQSTPRVCHSVSLHD